MRYIIANWKAHKTLEQAAEWIQKFLFLLSQSSKVKNALETDTLTIIIAAPLPFLALLADKTKSIKNLSLASQDISVFADGAYTGETTAEMLKGLVSYTLVGHSERRKHQHETKEQFEKKIKEALDHDIRPIYCISKHEDMIKETEIVAYEPEESIGTGKNKSFQDILSFKCDLDTFGVEAFIYGGSVNDSNIKEYSKDDIDGVLVGTASLDPEEFFSLVKKYEG